MHSPACVTVNLPACVCVSRMPGYKVRFGLSRHMITRVTGIEPVLTVLKTAVLPLNYTPKRPTRELPAVPTSGGYPLRRLLKNAADMIEELKRLDVLTAQFECDRCPRAGSR